MDREPEIIYARDVDLPEIVVIEACTEPFPWGAIDFREASTHRCCHTLVALAGGEVLAFAVIVVRARVVEVVKLAVHPNYRRRGVGSAILARIRSKMWRGTRMEMIAREGNLEGQMFLKSHGMQAEVFREFFPALPAGTEDGYHFTLEVPDDDLSPDRDPLAPS